MKKFFNIYQFIAPTILFPTAYYLWYMRLSSRHDITILVLSIPVISHYIIPAIGTNYTKLWEFNTKIMVGKFRPHHGFVFGSAMGMLALLCVDRYDQDTLKFFDLFRTGLLTGTFMAFWNWVYDIYAIRSGHIRVFNRPYAEGKGAEAISMDYAPLYFGIFGALYGIMINLIEYYITILNHNNLYLWFLIIFNMITTLVPVSIYMLIYYIRHGVTGIYPYNSSHNPP